MYRIYFEKRSINVCSPTDPALSDPNAVIFNTMGAEDLHALAEMFKAGAAVERVYVPTEEPEAVYHELCSCFKEVGAAGGLVSNRRGDYLLIRRDGLWDLPKGHQEKGEDIRVTALREVQEETGVDKLILRDLICITHHTYFRNGLWHLKHTWWYDMLYNDPVDLTPQREEDITKAAWVSRSTLDPFLKNTYPSIAEVFREAKV